MTTYLYIAVDDSRDLGKYLQADDDFTEEALEIIFNTLLEEACGAREVSADDLDAWSEVDNIEDVFSYSYFDRDTFLYFLADEHCEIPEDAEEEEEERIRDEFMDKAAADLEEYADDFANWLELSTCHGRTQDNEVHIIEGNCCSPTRYLIRDLNR